MFRGDGVADGRGRPVLLIPGFLAGDGSLAMMAGWLKRAGYRPSRAGMRANVDCSGAIVARLEERLEQLVAEQGQRAVIVGQSRGGNIAKVLGCERPDLVCGVVGLGSPQLDPLAVHPLVRAAGAGGQPAGLARCARAVQALLPRRRVLRGASGRTSPLRCPAASGWFRSTRSRDGVVDWRSCLDPDADSLVEIGASHCGMAVSPAAWRAVGDALNSLARAEARRRPSRRTNVRRFPRAA